MLLHLVQPATHADARRYIDAHPNACLCPFPRAAHLAAHSALFARLRCLVRAAAAADPASATLALAQDAALPCAARALWRLSHAALLSHSTSQAAAPCAAARASASRLPRAPALLLAEAVQWATEDAAGAHLCFRGSSAGRVRAWISANGQPPPRPCQRARAPRGATVHLVLTLQEAVLLCIPPVSHRLVRAERSIVALRDTVAMVSTLGGGYFLVKDIGRAIALARRQAWLAWRLGDDGLWRASHLHLIYIAIQVGAWDRGNALIAELTPGAAAAGDGRFLSMLSAATGYLARTREWAEAGRLGCSDAHRQALAVAQGSMVQQLVVQHFVEEEGVDDLAMLEGEMLG